MTVEQLEQANKILEKIEKLKEFKKAFNYNDAPNFIIAEYFTHPLVGEPIGKKSRLALRDYPGLQDFISGFLADEIAELKRQFEEL